MNREIKFRAWNKVTGKMMDWDFIKRMGNLNKLLTLTHVDVMQFTGLVDCLGREIYDRDILKVPESFENIAGVHEVYFNGDSYVTSSILFSDKETANKHSLIWRIKRGATVIGNIYENSELIK